MQPQESKLHMKPRVAYGCMMSYGSDTNCIASTCFNLTHPHLGIALEELEISPELGGVGGATLEGRDTLPKMDGSSG